MEMTEKPLQEMANSKAKDRLRPTVRPTERMSLSIRFFDDGLSIVGDKICFPVRRDSRAREKERKKKDETQILIFRAIHATSSESGSQSRAGQINDRLEMPPIILAFQGAHWHFNGYSTTPKSAALGEKYCCHFPSKV